MSKSPDRDMLCINAIAWAGTLGVVGMVGLDIVAGDLHRTAVAIGYMFVAVFLGQILVSGRGLNFGCLMVAATGGSFMFWAKPGALWFVDAMSVRLQSAGPLVNNWADLLSLPIGIVLLSMVLGLMLCAATGSRGVGAQAVLAGAVAAGCTLVPGNTTLLMGTAAALWCSIVFLSLSSWARDYASRASRGSGFVRLGQDGPLASLARGSTQPSTPSDPDLA